MSENKSFVEDRNDLIPASMLAAFAYCPRLCYLQFVQGEFLDSAEMADGRFQHRWIDAEQDGVPEDFVPFHARSVSLFAPQAGVCCRIDLLEGDGQVVTPVEYKRGEAPRAPAGLYEPHLMQLAAQCLALRENGFSCEGGMVYFIRSKERVPVKFDFALMDRARSLLADLRSMVVRGEIPSSSTPSPSPRRVGSLPPLPDIPRGSLAIVQGRAPGVGQWPCTACTARLRQPGQPIRAWALSSWLPIAGRGRWARREW